MVKHCLVAGLIQQEYSTLHGQGHSVHMCVELGIQTPLWPSASLQTVTSLSTFAGVQVFALVMDT